MAFRPTPEEARRLERAVDLARFTDGERFFWISGFLAIVVVETAMILQPRGWHSLWGVLVALGGLSVLYWRLRGGWLAGRVRGDHGLFGYGLARREQRAFTGLMLRHVLTGDNPLRDRPEHDPFATWGKRFEPLPDDEGGGA